MLSSCFNLVVTAGNTGRLRSVLEGETTHARFKAMANDLSLAIKGLSSVDVDVSVTAMASQFR